MAFDVDEDILQDFLVEAGEILELLQEQLVDLENNPEDGGLLNAIFRGYHTVKGGAGFLSLTELVDICHGAENVFDVMRTGQRTLTPELMDVILQATDEVVKMFSSVKAGKPLVAAEQDLLDTLHRLSRPESEDEVADDEESVAPSIDEDHEPVAVVSEKESGDFSEDEFEALLDELHGKAAPGAKDAVVEKKSPAKSGADEDISDDEFEALLDQLHGKGQFKAENEVPVPAKPVEAAKSNKAKSGDDEITDEEFEALLDQLHGKGQAPDTVEAEKPAAPKPTENKPAASAAKPVAPVAKKAPAPVVKKAPESAPASGDSDSKEDKKSGGAPQAETTVRVDTKRLDQIMNMVGELVLVRNRLISLGININDESMSKAIANLDVVTGDLQGAVMKTRMQPIKKVFGRFPRVVRDLARTLKKEITLELEGEETDLDKNLVEALADPLVHLVRNSVDHGIEPFRFIHWNIQAVPKGMAKDVV